MPQALSQSTIEHIEKLCERYPTRMAAMLPALHAAQAEAGHISDAVMMDVAHALDVPPVKVREAVTFYTMFYDKPVGRHVVKICRNLACQLRGADKIMQRAKELLQIEFNQTTPDGRITLQQEECLASCGTAPMLWCNDHIVENLTEEKLESFLQSLK